MHGQQDPRLPLGPLWQRAMSAWRPAPTDLEGFGLHGNFVFTTGEMAAACGVTRKTVNRWRTHGLTWDKADKAACALGLHPANVWGGEWWAGVGWEDVA